jgi:hydrogenase expression/formation protein HypE
MGDRILLSHGSGGKLSHELIERRFLPAFSNPMLDRLDDAAVLDFQGRLAFTTDSYVVSPIFFPGGDIGKLAVCGTVNDLAMVGATPLYLSLSFIIEEGLPEHELQRIVDSAKKAALEAGITIVTGDTKVVPHGSADKIFINSTGIGTVPDGVDISGSNAQAGDKIILSGTIGDHGIAVFSQREGLRFSSNIESDCAPLNGLVQEILNTRSHIHSLRDPTRGGLATTLKEIATQSKLGVKVEEEEIPIRQEVQAACEMLGFDPLHVANEGKVVAAVSPEDAEQVLKVVRRHKYGGDAAIIGEITADHPGRVAMRTRIGASRIVDMLVGDILPRIC